MKISSDRWLPKLVLSPTLAASLVFVYGFILVTIALSFTESRLLPHWEWAGVERYAELFDNDRFWVSAKNLAIFGTLFIGISLAVGLTVAILLDQKIRGEGFLRAIYLYPMALSFIVTGNAWKWLLNPGLGLEHIVQQWGWTSFTFDWLVNPDMAIYTVVIAGVWQSSGFAMALFLAGLRGVEGEIIKAAQVDGASLPTIYRRIIIPIKSFDLVMALTGGGPGNASDVPAIFMYQYSFTRGQLGVGAASAVMMLTTIVAVMVPLMYAESRSGSER